MNWYLYILECSDKSLYTGITTNIDRRIRQHNNKEGAKSLMGKLPAKLIYYEEYSDNVTAARREREIKSWKREKKLELIKGFKLMGLHLRTNCLH